MVVIQDFSSGYSTACTILIVYTLTALSYAPSPRIIRHDNKIKLWACSQGLDWGCSNDTVRFALIPYCCTNMIAGLESFYQSLKMQVAAAASEKDKLSCHDFSFEGDFEQGKATMSDLITRRFEVLWIASFLTLVYFALIWKEVSLRAKHRRYDIWNLQQAQILIRYRSWWHQEKEPCIVSTIIK